MLRPVDGTAGDPRRRSQPRGCNGRSATVTLGKGTVDVSPGRRLTLSNGVFEVPNARVKTPPARVSFRVEGSVPAAAELLALDRLREFSGAPFDPGRRRAARSQRQVQLGMPLRPDLPTGSTDYDITVDLTNFSADKMLFGQKVEAQTLRVTANNQQYEIKGDVEVARRAGPDRVPQAQPASPMPRSGSRRRSTRPREPGLASMSAARLRAAADASSIGRVGLDDREGRFNVEADLTATKIDNLLPGWVKPAGRPARARLHAGQRRNPARCGSTIC